MNYINEAFETNWIAPLGKNVDSFEKEASGYAGVKYGAALSSGTAAIHMALKAAGIGKGDIVLCSDLTFSASANPIIYEGAVPVFIDSDMKTWNMDPAALRLAFEKYPEAKAVIIVDLYGLSAEYDELLKICRQHNAVVIEDSAEALGSSYKGKKCGSFGDYGILSFNGNKIITTSGGGMLLSDNEERIAKVRFWSTQAREKARHYQHEELGYNYRMSNIVAGIGRGQLEVLDMRVEKKRHIFDLYKKGFEEIKEIEMEPQNENCFSNCWLSCIRISEKSNVSPLDIMEMLEKENIESRPIWKPMHMQPFYSDCDFITDRKSGSNGEDIFRTGVCLPSDTKMSDETQLEIIRLIKNMF